MAERTVYKIPDTKIRLFTRGTSKNLHCRFNIKGKQYKKPLETTVRKHAVKLAKEIYHQTLHDVLEGRPTKPLTFAEVADSFVERRREETVLNCKSIKSFEHLYAARVERYFKPFLADKYLHEITTKDISRYKTWRQKYYSTGPGKREKTLSYKRSNAKGAVVTPFKGKPPNLTTIGRELGTLKQVFVFAVKENWLGIEKLPEFELPAEEHVKKATFEGFEITKIRKHLMKTYKRHAKELEQDPTRKPKLTDYLRHRVFTDVFEIAVATAMRPVEIERLTWKQVLFFHKGKRLPFKNITEAKIKDYDVRLTNVSGKTRPRDVIPMKSCAPSFNSLYEIWDLVLDRAPEGDEPVLINPDCTSRNWPKSMFETLLKDLDLTYDSSGKKRTAYSLRHYAITEWYKKIGNIEKVAQNVGNSPDELRRSYDHVSIEHYADDFGMEE